MTNDFPTPVPEIPVTDLGRALAYYKDQLGFTVDWGDEGGVGISGVSRGQCRLFLTNRAFREMYGNPGHVVNWLNLNSKQEVNDLHEEWRRGGARIESAPESKPWKLHEFTAADLDGNLLRVFYDFRRETE
jgi:predicted lactoylglutathione lyase